MKDQIERRVLNLEGCELRADDVDGKQKIRGYAAVFDKWSENLGYFREKIARGAFAESLSRNDDVFALMDHDHSLVLGRRKAKTLEVREDEKGLYVEIDPPDTQLGRDILTSLKRGDLDKMSFGFYTRKQEWKELPDGKMERTLTAVDLFDVSIVTMPAYPDTSVAVRSLEQYKKEAMPEPEPDTGEIELAEARLKLVG